MFFNVPREPSPSKPGLVLNDWTGGATLAPITTRIRRIPSEVVLGTDDGMTRECALNLDSIITIPRSCLRERLASLSPERLKGIENAIHFALGLDKRAIVRRGGGHACLRYS
ncbi:MAG: type II toxin-antitoxin system PemK/MazF family toxin [Dehalococcoidia bacterium]|nr:type II toxin-antitoxin system PemK/MazF family toxin [Dehalococcoidia bacterium]